MTYKIVNSNCVKYIASGIAFPLSDGNADYEEYKTWLALGNTPEAADIVIIPKSELLKKIDSDVDKIYADAVGNRTTEYQTAESEATAYKAALYTGAVPSCVASWATASGLSNQAAADNILAQATAWRGAVSAIRAQRLSAKAAVNANSTTAMAAWAGFVSVIRGQLGL